MKQRYLGLDNLRALALLSMILYHAVWDLVYLYGRNWSWYHGNAAFLWQQSICWTFILLSGFCHGFSKRPFRQGMLVSGAGLLVTVVTTVASPESRVIFGVLTMIGASALLLRAFRRFFESIPAVWGLLLMSLLFAVTYQVNDGAFGFFGLELLEVPGSFYRNALTAFVGFPYVGFVSGDYFSLLPWCFLYFAGYFLWRIWKMHGRPVVSIFEKKVPAVTWIGQHSLLIYLLHQPVIYLIMELVKK